MKCDPNTLKSLPKLIYSGMIAAIFIYIIILKYMRLYGAVGILPESTSDVIYHVFLVFSILIAAFTRPVMSRIMQLNIVKKEMLIEHGLREDQYGVFVKNQVSLMMAAFYELIALFGLLLGILGGDWMKIYSLIFLSFFMLIINFPKDTAPYSYEL